MLDNLQTSVVRVHIPNEWRPLAGGPCVPLAAYLLGTQKTRHMGTWRDTFHHQMDFGPACVLAEDAAAADFILFPYAWEPRFARLWAEQHRRIDARSRATGRPVICQGVSADILDPELIRLPFQQGWYLSTSLVRTRKPAHALGLSYFIPDCREKHAAGPPVLPKPDKPTVGFCGVAAPFETPPGKTKCMDVLRLGLTYAAALGFDPEELARRFGNNTKHAYRARLVLQFRRNPEVDCDFKLRRVGGLVDHAYTNRGDQDSYNVDFYRNLEANLYNVCCRGTENYSVRFYETLCMGRIPIVVDTDMVLPFDGSIDYRKHAVWIDKKEVSRAAQILLAFHRDHTAEDLDRIQRSNRALWESHLSHTAFYRRLVESIASKGRG